MSKHVQVEIARTFPPLRFKGPVVFPEHVYPSLKRAPPADGFPIGEEVKLESDFTIFLSSPEFNRAMEAACDYPARTAILDIPLRHSFDFDTPVVFLSINAEMRFRGRVHAVRCNKGEYVSVTFRSLESQERLKSPVVIPDRNRDPDTSKFLFLADLLDGDEQIRLKEEPVELASCTLSPYFIQTLLASENLTIAEWRRNLQSVAKGSFFYLVPSAFSDDLLFDAIFPNPQDRASGLVLITGATGSGKTTVLNGLIRKYVASKMGHSRRSPHFVVLGDPVETPFFEYKSKLKPADCLWGDENPLCSAKVQQHFWGQRVLDCTERVIGIDTPSVEEALKDALRETPSAVIVSELREPADFRAALEFAATGHLIFATAHNTSLVDAVGKLMRISGAGNPSDRATLGQRVKAVIHLDPRERDCDKTGAKSKANIPMLWRTNSSGLRNFVSEGLSSIYPKSPLDSSQADGGPSVLGRTWFMRELEKKASEKLKNEPLLKEYAEITPALFAKFMQLARHLDLHSY